MGTRRSSSYRLSIGGEFQICLCHDPFEYCAGDSLYYINVLTNIRVQAYRGDPQYHCNVTDSVELISGRESWTFHQMTQALAPSSSKSLENCQPDKHFFSYVSEIPFQCEPRKLQFS